MKSMSIRMEVEQRRKQTCPGCQVCWNTGRRTIGVLCLLSDVFSISQLFPSGIIVYLMPCNEEENHVVADFLSCENPVLIGIECEMDESLLVLW